MVTDASKSIHSLGGSPGRNSEIEILPGAVMGGDNGGQIGFQRFEAQEFGVADGENGLEMGCLELPGAAKGGVQAAGRLSRCPRIRQPAPLRTKSVPKRDMAGPFRRSWRSVASPVPGRLHGFVAAWSVAEGSGWIDHAEAGRAGAGEGGGTKPEFHGVRFDTRVTFPCGR